MLGSPHLHVARAGAGPADDRSRAPTSGRSASCSTSCSRGQTPARAPADARAGHPRDLLAARALDPGARAVGRRRRSRRIVHRALQPDPGQRFQSAYEMYTALQAVTQGQPSFRRLDIQPLSHGAAHAHRAVAGSAPDVPTNGTQHGMTQSPLAPAPPKSSGRRVRDDRRRRARRSSASPGSVPP